jgi:flagellar hook-associated protein 1 FlgK
MPVNFASYQIAVSGMRVNQHALNVTGHNIANASTPGYVRQQAIIASNYFQTVNTRAGMQQFGLGADIQEVRQIRHMFLDNTFRRENTTLGYWEARRKTFEDVQAIMGEPMEEGLQNAMNAFWDSWQELSKTPDNLTVRALVRQRGENLVHYVNHMGQQLDKLQDDINNEIIVRINEVNTILESVAELNLKILSTEVSGDTANDYRDQRNNLLDRLSKLVDCDIQEMQDGQVDILVSGYFLVTKGTYKTMYAGENQKGSSFVVPKLEGTNIEIPLNNGTIKGLLESRGEVFSAVGSVENGTPDTRADIVFAVDVSNDSTDDYLAKVKAGIAEYIKELDKRGVDYNLRLITYNSGIEHSESYGRDGGALLADIPDTAPDPLDSGNNFSGIGGVDGVLEALEEIDDWNGDSRYAMVFTAESINGDDGADAGYVDRLKALGVKTSVVTDSTYFTEGEPADEAGWDEISQGTGGSLYDMAAEDYQDIMAYAVSDVNTDINYHISEIEYSTNIVSDLKKKLNALINVMMREINYLHQSGRTMHIPSLQGEAFFVAINSELPLEMGNIKLNDNLTDLNNIVASRGDDSGDNTIARQIANLRNQAVMMDTTGILNLDDYYQAIILAIGNGGADAASIAEGQRTLVQSADDYRQSIMGVSMDEEMTNMIKYKFAYNASARAASVLDEMLETVISRMGLAGR